MTSVDIRKLVLNESLSGSGFDFALVEIIQEQLAELIQQNVFSEDICAELASKQAHTQLKDITLQITPGASMHKYGKQIAQVIFDRLFAN